MNAIALLSLIGVTAVVRADDRKEIDALYNKVASAMMAKDLNGILATGTKDFSYTEDGKTMTGEQISAQMKQQFQMVKGPIKCKMTVLSCKITGKTATVLSSETSEMQIDEQDGKPHKYTSVGKSKDICVKTDKGWLMKSVTVVSSTMTRDGKPFDPKMTMSGKK
jgi:ketosteroid isomerase-like protein